MGQKVWFMKDNKVTAGIIKQVEVKIDISDIGESERQTVRYGIRPTVGGTLEIFSDYGLYANSKELIKSLVPKSE